MNRANNDATLSKLGDIYQYYIALLECFKMSENEKILIEVCGDVSKVSKDTSFQMEIKHHINASLITDRNLDFWKTLWNWINEFDRIKDFSKLVLYTTSDIAKNSLLFEWNEKKECEKYSILKSIGTEIKSREKTFRKIYSNIFNEEKFNIKKIKSVLKRFEIINKQQQISNISRNFNRFIPFIPEQNREKFIASLLGIILDKVKEKPHIWEISYTDFEQILQETTPFYVKPDSSPLPTEYAQLDPPEAIEKEHQEKVFVRAIRNIQYDKEIPKAINNYWRTNMTIIKYYDNNPVFNKSILEYKRNLTDKLSYTKESIKIDHENSTRDVQLKESKKFFSKVMTWDASPFGSINPNQPFFQNGVIHDIVNDKKFSWDVNDEI